ncbi:hypothetical protein ACQW08_04830 [Gluconobacter japonicus]|uniref:hypothetical protein n=1 Tax=Gluconobacter japonicus TaxID=376620 RepID=UPI003D2C0AD7
MIDLMCTYNSIKNLINKDFSFLLCPSCQGGVRFSRDCFPKFFGGEEILCNNCAKNTNLYHLFLNTLKNSHFFLNKIPIFIAGYEEAFFKFRIEENSIIQIRFEDYGIPTNSRIININYTSGGPSFIQPIEIHGNNVPLRRRGNVVNLYGVPIVNSEEEITETYSDINVSVIYSPVDVDDIARDSLMRAFYWLLSDEFPEMILSSVVSLEISFKRLCKKFHIDLNNVKDKDILKKINQEIALPLNIPPLNEEIVHTIRRLWGSRDNIAHKGILIDGYSRESAQKQISSAFFGFKYCEFLEKKANRSPTN